MATNDEWLGQVREEIIDPDLPIIDPHHHLWDFPGSRYMLDELNADTGSGHNVRATVFVECTAMYRAEGPEHLKPVGETEFVNGIAAQSASGLYGEMRACKGIVGFADLALGAAVEEVLEAHIIAAPDRFRGIRHASAFDDSDEVRPSHTNPPKFLFGQSEFREGFAKLANYGLSFDAWLFHHQIPELTALARAFPETTIILDHFGGPLGIGPHEGRRSEIFAQWMTDMVDLSECPNVVAKIGGINMAVNGFDWHKRDTPPTSDELVAATQDYYLHTIDAFGPDRCMFESNFPVDKLSCSYAVLWNAFKKIASGFSPEEKTALFHDTAKRVYRLD
ncbi:MAG: amidohydrolase family protein [Parvibaculum sp.]|uniref:amidohydrolase family protein n=1 Tax=Parvibaculum sp. TaxID=2024848 RepID=UPI0025D49FF8|nr:amidohydrolase family protein [Parvibaculum sp.]MCE9649167.1 amidohydrolase family protein [Parvibaculum sp.]